MIQHSGLLDTVTQATTLKFFLRDGGGGGGGGGVEGGEERRESKRLSLAARCTVVLCFACGAIMRCNAHYENFF